MTNFLMNRLFSGDLPRRRALGAALLLVFVALALAPFLTAGASSGFIIIMSSVPGETRK